MIIQWLFHNLNEIATSKCEVLDFDLIAITMTFHPITAEKMYLK